MYALSLAVLSKMESTCFRNANTESNIILKDSPWMQCTQCYYPRNLHLFVELNLHLFVELSNLDYYSDCEIVNEYIIPLIYRYGLVFGVHFNYFGGFHVL